MSLTLNVNGTDKTNQIKWKSLKKRSVLTRQPDTLTFSLLNYPTKTWRPAISDVVTLYDGATLIFAGTVIETGDSLMGGLLKDFIVTCKDYTHLLDRNLVSKNYAGMTGTAIVTDIISTFCSGGGFTVANVAVPYVVSAVTFNYLTPSQCFQKICEMIPGYDWYVDYNKDIHFFLQGSRTAPFSLSDTSANFIYESLEIDQDTTQLRNFVTIRGGDTIGTAVDNLQVADGKQRVFFVGYNLNTFLAYKALAASPTSFSALTVGADGIDDPTTVDVLYNPNQGLMTFPDASKPAVGDVVKYTGVPVFPLITQQQDPVSVSAYGTYQYLIIDKTITTRLAANQRAQAELLQYGNPISRVMFQTETSGLISGQVITIICPLRGVSGSYKISKVEMKLKTPSPSTSKFLFTIEAVSTLKINLVDILNKLLVKNPADQIQIGSNEVVDRIFSSFETITIGESLVVGTSHHITEGLSVGETFNNRGTNFGTIFVAGPYTPSTTKRVFILNGSLLG